MEQIQQMVEQMARRAKEASRDIGTASLEARNRALAAMAQALRENQDAILQANDRDMAAAREKGTGESLLDRLKLTPARLEGMASALEDLCKLPDPLGNVQQERMLYNGIQLQRVSVPLGVVAMVYEARPNVTADAAGICVKTGNACILRGGSMALNSNITVAEILREAAVSAGMPQNCIQALQTPDRRATDVLLRMRGLVDLLIPRGGAGLIRHCVENATVPVIETGVGNCHVYVEATANIQWARDIIVNAKTQRPGVCNAIESILMDAAIVPQVLLPILQDLHEHGVKVHGDQTVCSLAEQVGIPCLPATAEDWGTEYLDLEISIKTVAGYGEAIDHINAYGTHHSECIVTQNQEAADAFVAQVDAAAVYVNASTRFTDGGEFGLGAEIGISTQKLHARGPFALDALTSYKYILRGEGQVRG